MASSGAAVVSLFLLCTIGVTCIEASYTWTSVPKTWIGYTKFHHGGTHSYLIPNVIPSSATEVLIYARMYCSYARRQADIDVRVFTQTGNARYEK